jgi:hypothetical protein
MRSSPTTSYGTQRSVDIEIFVDPTSKQLQPFIIPFIATHSSIPFNTGNSSLTPGTYSTIFVQVSHSSDSSIVAIAQANVYFFGGKLTCNIVNVIVHTSHRNCGYGLLVLKQLIATSVKSHGAVLATATLQPTTAHISSRLFKSAGFELSSISSEKNQIYSRYLRPTKSILSPAKSPLIKSKQNSPIRIGNILGSSHESVVNGGNTSEILQQQQWTNDVSIEYWANGGARKILNVDVPSFNHACTMLNNNSNSDGGISKSSNLHNIPTNVATHLCSLKRVDFNQRVSLSLGELLALKLSKQWWLDLQIPITESNAIKHAQKTFLNEQKKKQMKHSSQKQKILKAGNQFREESSSFKEEKNHNEEIIQLREKLRLSELSLRKATMLLKLKQQKMSNESSDGINSSSTFSNLRSMTTPPRIPTKFSQELSSQGVQNIVSPGDLSFQISGTRISNRGLPRKNVVLTEKRTEMRDDNGSNNNDDESKKESSMRAMAELHKKKIENQIDDATMKRPGGIRLDFVDDNNSNKKKIRERSPLRRFLEKSPCARPFDERRSRSGSSSGSKKQTDGKEKNAALASLEARRREADAVKETLLLEISSPENKNSETIFSKLSEEQLERARSRVAVMLEEEKKMVNRMLKDEVGKVEVDVQNMRQ